ncbi:MAG: HD domain-containing protein [Bacteroidia bacterium]|nr:HD domain-containing protein [Bacteroidia bacterium]MDW8089172.1 HD domain-containing protein [Bacteroidia bacterium]
MLRTAKIINDPVHGFIHVPEGRILRALGHPVVQRLRRITQLGLAQFVYPGAVHTRFGHALGVLHLAEEALLSLSRKGLAIPPSTWEAVLLGALLHDIGHGPFSHSLEGSILPYNHEQISQALLGLMEAELGDLSEVRLLWENQHPLRFLSDLISGQLDVDRLDYLVRDSFYTGVQEGLVGTERLIYTMNVAENRLVIEEKGHTSVEKFIITRRFMYWQVYLHKGVLGSEWLLRRWWEAYKLEGKKRSYLEELWKLPLEAALPEFLQLDETTIWQWIQASSDSKFPPLRILSRALLYRVPFKVTFTERASATLREGWQHTLSSALRPWAEWFWIEGLAENQTYSPQAGGEIRLLRKDGTTAPLSELSPWLQPLESPTKRAFVGAIPAASLESLRR